MNKEMLSILSGLSTLGEAIASGRQSRKEALETLGKHKTLLQKHLSGMERADGVKAMKDAKIHEVIVAMVARIVWPNAKPKAHKFKADEKAKILAIIPEDPKEARAWVKGLVALIKKARPFPAKDEGEE